ncbi:hypothetical protein STREPTOSP366_64170 [Streptomyces variabilis]
MGRVDSVIGVGGRRRRSAATHRRCRRARSSPTTLSIILTSNKTFSEWGQVFGDEVLATAILDRLLHHCEVISINGPSYRLENRLKAIERENDVA